MEGLRPARRLSEEAIRLHSAMVAYKCMCKNLTPEEREKMKLDKRAAKKQALQQFALQKEESKRLCKLKKPVTIIEKRISKREFKALVKQQLQEAERLATEKAERERELVADRIEEARIQLAAGSSNVPFRINQKTVVYLKHGQDPQAVYNKYKYLNE